VSLVICVIAAALTFSGIAGPAFVVVKLVLLGSIAMILTLIVIGIATHEKIEEYLRTGLETG
jgi:uncharacterized membrane protein YtjA (UPF0391 family)